MKLPTVEDFVRRKHLALRNSWCRFRHMEIYLRHSQRWIENGLAPSLDIANCNVNPRFRGKGEFKAVLALIADLLSDDHVMYAENVVENRLQAHYLRTGWHLSDTVGIGHTPCYYIRAKDAKAGVLTT